MRTGLNSIAAWATPVMRAGKSAPPALGHGGSPKVGGGPANRSIARSTIELGEDQA